MRLFGKGKVRPIQSFESLAAPDIGSLTDEFEKRTALQNDVRKRRMEWAAMGDGLITGSCAYAAAVAASFEAHQVLLDMPSALDSVAVGGVGAEHLTTAQQIGYQSWIEGHIGESVAASVLTEHGHHVAFAPIPNQPGWDLLVDGVPTQIKVGEHAAANIADHFQRYPEIPVLTDPHTAALLHNPMVQGLPGLEADHVHDLAVGHVVATHLANFGTDQSLHPIGSVGDLHVDHMDGFHHVGALDHADGLDLTPHIPWITVGLGAFREVKLSDRYGGAFAESIGAVAADAAGVAIGAKGGMIAGSLFGPVGMLVGAIGGALLGKGVVNSARQSNVQSEIDSLKPDLDRIDRSWRSAANSFRSEAERIVSRWNQVFAERSQSYRAAYKDEVRRLLGEHNEAALQFAINMHSSFDGFDAALLEDLSTIRARYSIRPAWQRVLVPSVADAARPLAESWIAAKRAEMENWRNRFASMLARAELGDPVDASHARELLMVFVGKFKIWDDSASEILQRTLNSFDLISREATVAHKRASSVVLSELSRVEAVARKELELLWSRHEADLRRLVSQVDPKVREVARHAARAHLTAFSPPLQLLEQQSKAVKEGIRKNTAGAERLQQLPAFA